MSASRLLASPRRTARRYAAELRASQSFLAAEVGGGGWLNLGQFRWRNVTLGRAARATVGVLTPLVIGFATHHVEYGTFAALGAVPAGMVSFQGVTRTRVLLVTLAVAGMAISTFVGGAAAYGMSWALVPVIVLWCYVAGICAALGPAAIVVTTQWPVAVLIASAIPLRPADAALRAVLVLAGGLWQGALVVSSWAFSLGTAERTAMADSYATLSRYAAELAAGGEEPPPPDALPGTKALRDPNPLMRSIARQYLIDLMEESERIRTTLAVVRGPGTDGASADRQHDHGLAGARREVLAASAAALGEIAEALRARPSQRQDHLDAARARLNPDGTVDGHAWSWAGESLRGQLRSAIRITQRLNDTQPGRSRKATMRPTTRLPVREMLLTLRANVGVSSEAGRHALRLAIVAGVAEVIAQSAALPHGYWVTLTVLIVLRPDYGSTLYRGLQRAGGTVVGAGLGVATVLLGHFGNWALLTALGLSLLGAYAVLTVNYLFFAIFLTDYVVVLLALLGLPADQTAVDRLIGTGVGAGLALLAYVLWPTWERTSASEKFARLILTECRFAALLLHGWSDPASDEARQAVASKLAARRARLDADASADRLTDEPERPPMTRELGQALISAGHRLAISTLALEAAVGAHHAALRRAAQPVPAGPSGAPADLPAPEADRSESLTRRPDPLQEQLDRLGGMIRQAGAQLAESLRRMGPPGPLPPMREVQARLPRDDDDAIGLFAATDALVDSLNTIRDILRQNLTAGRG
ncbi:MAG TPA: FUSC family protein [Streptosporangiaceae bacterium]|nr:FUSC family protein [Streptosporangiaceae bacterium]